MLKIGEFSKITNVPIKTIRYYEDIGLFTPAEVDSVTGYRRFDENNIEQLLKIVYLKENGFRLAEIKNLNDKTLMKKIQELKKKAKNLKKSISNISNLYKNEKGELIMKNFINDQKLIGKWKLKGIAYKKDDVMNGNLEQDKNYLLKELVFLPNGKDFWVVYFWTKGYIFLNDVPMKYEFVGDDLVIAIDWDKENKPEFYTVYENVDHRPYTQEELIKKDNTDLPFVDDKKLKGIWNVCGFVKDIKDFNSEENKASYMYKTLVILDNGQSIMTFSDGTSKQNFVTWTKDYIINKDWQVTQHYKIKDINSETYLFMEHKSGDYIYGNLKPKFYVFKKQK